MDAAACLRADFAPGNVPKGVAWSPDGTCLLTATEDARVRLYEVPGAVLDGGAPPSRDWAETFACAEGEAVYDYKWYPQMHSGDPISCCLASSRQRPASAHLWDAFTGACRGSYVGRDHLDENAPAYSLAFARRARSLCGGDRCVPRLRHGPLRLRLRRAADGGDAPRQVGRQGPAGRPGLPGRGRPRWARARRANRGPRRREPSTGPALRVCKDKPLGGVTALAFDGRGRLFAACRNERDRACVRGFDLRTGAVAVRCRRGATPSHQRLGFDLREDRLLAGGADGRVFVFDVAPVVFDGRRAGRAVVASSPGAGLLQRRGLPPAPAPRRAGVRPAPRGPGLVERRQRRPARTPAAPAPAVAVLQWPDA
ncbi:telomerase Cajal body protein [Aureococcus anophagefferens]|uniref:Telomerase Cajal body protein n=1 Tax=Aureococcus anophagefferens TaxID=44056 RepID=A0ABR1FZA5_AURAN